MKVYTNIFLWAVATVLITPCKSKQNIVGTTPIQYESIDEHSPSVLIIMYDKEVGKESLLKAIKEYNAEIMYDYSIITGLAIKKPANKTLHETKAYFKKVKDVLPVEYDRINHIAKSVKTKLEV